MANRARSIQPLLGASLVLTGALGAWLPGAEGGSPASALVWLAVVAAGCGALAAGLGLGLAPFGWLLPLAWCAPVAWLARDARGELDLLAACVAWSGLFALGAALGELGRRRRWNPFGVAGALLLAGVVASGLPLRGALDARPWPVPAARVLFDLAPTTLVLESAGLDWMRHAATYDAVATDRFQRAPYRGPLAGSVLLLVGCALAVLARTPRDPANALAPGERG